MAEKSLKKKTVSGTIWSVIDAFSGQGVSFIVGIILARLLSPEEYGLIGICTIFTVVLNGIVDSGFSSALIRKKEVHDSDYNTMFLTNLGISIVLYIFLFLCSPFIAKFFNREELVFLVRVTGLVLIFNALSIVQVTVLTRRIDFKSKTKASLLSSIASGCLGIVMAYLNLGVWALVGQILSRQLLYTICLWVINKWLPNLHFDIKSFSYMWGFGWKILCSVVLNNLWKQLYQVVVGRFYSPFVLGQYTKSKEYANIFSSSLTLVVQRVTYPVLSEIQDDATRLKNSYRLLIKVSTFITCICMFFLAGISTPLIYCLIGAKWDLAARYLPLICFSMTVYPLDAINLNMLQVQGRSDLLLYLEILKKIVLVVPLLIGVFIGIIPMLWANLFTSVVCFFLNSHYSGRQLNYSSFRQLKDVIPSFGIGLIIFVAVWFLKYLPLPHLFVLLLQIIVGLFVFFAVCESVHLQEYIELKKISYNFISRIKHRS